MKLQENIKEFLTIIGEDIHREGIKGTPERVAKSWKELLTPPEFNPTVFDANGYDQMIIEKDIQYYTFCEHHMLPFFGTASIGYIPQEKIIGISKLARCVEYYSKRLNTQEYFTNNIAEYLCDKLKPKGLAVIVNGRHLCQEMRGVMKKGYMITSALRGVMLDKSIARKEFFDLCKK